MYRNKAQNRLRHLHTKRISADLNIESVNRVSGIADFKISDMAGNKFRNLFQKGKQKNSLR